MAGVNVHGGMLIANPGTVGVNVFSGQLLAGPLTPGVRVMGGFLVSFPTSARVNVFSAELLVTELTGVVAKQVPTAVRGLEGFRRFFMVGGLLQEVWTGGVDPLPPNPPTGGNGSLGSDALGARTLGA